MLPLATVSSDWLFLTLPGASHLEALHLQESLLIFAALLQGRLHPKYASQYLLRCIIHARHLSPYPSPLQVRQCRRVRVLIQPGPLLPALPHPPSYRLAKLRPIELTTGIPDISGLPVLDRVLDPGGTQGPVRCRLILARRVLVEGLVLEVLEEERGRGEGAGRVPNRLEPKGWEASSPGLQCYVGLARTKLGSWVTVQ